MHSKCMLREITQEKAQGYSWLMFISVWDQASPNKKIFLQEQSGLSWVQAKIRLD